MSGTGQSVRRVAVADGDELSRVQASQFVDAVLMNPINRVLLQRLHALALPDCWLVAGCLFQAVWNRQQGRAPAAGVKDYDIFYFDAADTSYAAEDQVIQRVRAALADLDITFDVKNQARVHLWYQQRFGWPYPQLASARDGIARFLIAGTCIGVSPVMAAEDELSVELFAPFGLDDCFSGRLRPNPLIADPVAAFHAKAESYRARWPHLIIENQVAPAPDMGHSARLQLPSRAQTAVMSAVTQ
jgi:uncharacterized protein